MKAWFLLCLLAACGGSTGPDTSAGVIDKMILKTTATQFYSVGAKYRFNDNWQAIDSHGLTIPLVDTAGKAINLGLRYGLGDSLPDQSQVVDSTGGFALPAFIGFLYVFAPTIRSPVELMGQQYIAVQ